MLSLQTWRRLRTAVQLIGAVLVAWNLLAVAACVGEYIYGNQANDNSAYDNQAACFGCVITSGPFPWFFRFIGMNPTATFVAVSAIATIFIAWFTYTLKRSTDNLWGVTDKTLRHAERTTQSELRAYVYIVMTTVGYPFPPQVPQFIGIGFKITNSGQTWARNLVVRKERIDREFGVEYDPWDRVNWDEMKTQSMVLGPGQTIGMQLTDHPITVIPEVANQTIGWDYAVWVTYEDTVTDPPIPRQTQSLVRLGADHHGGTSFQMLPGHNCADDDCQKG